MPRIPVLKSLKFICIRQPSAARRTYKSSIKNTALIFLHAVAAFNRNGPPFALGLSPPSPSHILPVFCLLLCSTLSFLSHSSWVFVYILVILKIVSSLPITFFFLVPISSCVALITVSYENYSPIICSSQKENKGKRFSNYIAQPSSLGSDIINISPWIQPRRMRRCNRPSHIWPLLIPVTICQDHQVRNVSSTPIFPMSINLPTIYSFNFYFISLLKDNGFCLCSVPLPSPRTPTVQ